MVGSQAQPIYTGAMTLRDFVARAGAGDAADLPFGAATALYVLLTDRTAVEAGAGGTLADPNGPLSPRLAELVDRARAASADLVAPASEGGFDVAWTSLRLGSASSRPRRIPLL